MKVSVRGKHFEVPERVEERARQKLSRLEHYLPLLGDASIEVDVTHQKAKKPEQRFIVHVTVSAHGVHLRAEEEAAQAETAIDQVVHVLTRQARQHKQRLYNRNRNRKGAAAELEEPAPEEDESPRLRDRIGRVKRFSLKPMTSEEAIEQIEALGHEFFVFFDADSRRVAVLYRRRAGDFGLIIPELP